MICVSYRTVCTLPVSTMLRASQSAQDCGYERLQEQAENDDKDHCQCIFHNLNFDSFSLLFQTFRPRDAYIFLHPESESRKMKASRRRRIRSCQKRKIVCLPCPQVWLDASMGELRFAERIYANTRGRMNGLTASSQKKKDTACDDTTILWYCRNNDTMIL